MVGDGRCCESQVEAEGDKRGANESSDELADMALALTLLLVGHTPDNVPPFHAGQGLYPSHQEPQSAHAHNSLIAHERKGAACRTGSLGEIGRRVWDKCYC